jgi:vanillate O-demethylase monooxygenase subunit
VSGTAAPWVDDAWYAVAAAEEVGSTPLARTVLGQRLVLWRTASGAPAVLLDRCPHRFAPLSMGRVAGEALACLYHGIQFDAEGRCRHIPGQAGIPAGAQVRSFPVRERYGLVFAWLGEPANAAATPLVDIPQYGAPGWGLSRGYDRFAAHWQLITDNLIDPAHTSFVHQRTIGNDAGDEVPVQARELADGTLQCGRWIRGAPPVPVVRRFTGLDGPTDRWQLYHLKPPSTSWVDFGAYASGPDPGPEAQATAPYRVLSYAFITPEDEGHSHYFSFQLRNVAVDDAAVTAEFEALYRLTFDEDRQLLEAIQREEAAHPGLQPMRIASDVGLVRLRRVQQRLLQDAGPTPHASAAGSSVSTSPIAVG